MSKCAAGVPFTRDGKCPKCSNDPSGVCWPAINRDMAAIPSARAALTSVSNQLEFLDMPKYTRDLVVSALDALDASPFGA